MAAVLALFALWINSLLHQEGMSKAASDTETGVLSTKEGRVITTGFSPSVLSSEEEFDQDSVSSEVITYVDEGDGATKSLLVIRGSLTREEVTSMISFCEETGYDSLIGVYDPSYRNNSRLMVQDEGFCERWYRRLLPHVVPYQQHLNSMEERNKWSESEMVGLNPRLRICKYPASGVFKTHSDSAVSNETSYSRLTCMAYLTDVPEEQGGATRFYGFEANAYGEWKNTVKAKVQPSAGLVVIFPHEYKHDGQETNIDGKIILRSDVLFAR